MKLETVPYLITESFLERREFGGVKVGANEGEVIQLDDEKYTEIRELDGNSFATVKAGLKMLMRSLATERAKHNIQVNGIGSGYFAMSETEPSHVEIHPFIMFVFNKKPPERWSFPKEHVGAAVFLASKSCDFMNGQIVYVDGGILVTVGEPTNIN